MKKFITLKRIGLFLAVVVLSVALAVFGAFAFRLWQVDTMLAFIEDVKAGKYRPSGYVSAFCTDSKEVKKITLTSKYDPVPFVFNVPVEYMDMRYQHDEEAGKALSLNVSFDTLNSRCHDDPEFRNQRKNLGIELIKSARLGAYISKNRDRYTNINRYEKIQLEQYPDFYIYSIKNSARRHYATLQLIEEMNSMPSDYLLRCARMGRNEYLGACTISFIYKDSLYTKVDFSAVQLGNVRSIYKKVIKIIDKFIVES